MTTQISRRFVCTVKQEDASLVPQHEENGLLVIKSLLPIKLGFEQKTVIHSLDDNRLYSHGPATLLATRSMSVFSSSIKLLAETHYYKNMIAGHLSRMGVPESEWSYIFRRIFRVVDVVVPNVVIDVTISDVTTLTYDNYARTVEDMVVSESLERYRAKLIPATKSSIEGLEKVRVDNLEGEEEEEQCSRPKKRSRQSCVICLDPLDAARTTEEQDSCAEQEVTINRLPCSHLYHGECIVMWLKINHMCPMCRYPMPTVEEAKPLQSIT